MITTINEFRKINETKQQLDLINYDNIASIMTESLSHNENLYRNTSQQWLINLLTDGSIMTENKEWISISQDHNSGGMDNYGHCRIVFNEEMIYNQGAIEIDYDVDFFREFPAICAHVTGFSTEKEYYANLGYSDAEEADENSELNWEQYCETFSGEDEVVIHEIKYEPGLILSIELINEQLEPELEHLLKKYSIVY